MDGISFGKQVKPRSAAAIATRKVQGWLDAYAASSDGSWVCLQGPSGGLLKAEEIECDMPDCAPIETLLTFFCEEANEFTKVLKPIAEVSQAEINEALSELKQLVLLGGDDETEVVEKKGTEKTAGAGNTSQDGPNNSIYDPLEMDTVMAAPEAKFASSFASNTSKTSSFTSSSSTIGAPATDGEGARKRKRAFFKGVGGGLLGGLGGAAATLWATHVVAQRGSRKGSVELSFQIALVTVATAGVRSMWRRASEAREAAAATAREAERRNASIAAAARRKMPREFRARGCPCCNKSNFMPGKF